MIRTTLLVFCLLPCIAIGQNSRVTWYTFDMGFAVSTAGNTSTKSAVGQVFVGLMQQANTRIESGFLVDTLLRGPLVAVGEKEGLPSVYGLSQNYPNPFNPSTTIRYELPRRSTVELHIYNILGQRVATLVNEEQDAGRYVLLWTGENDAGLQVSSGVYFYRLFARDVSSNAERTFVETRKLILLR